jgi:hypothetical protein
MTHFAASDGGPATMGRWMSGMEAIAGVEWVFPPMALIAGIGAEDVFSPTYIQVRGQAVATLPPLRGVAEGGFRVWF